MAQLTTFNPQLSAAAATFTNHVTISETNNTYEGQDIVISCATVTVDIRGLAGAVVRGVKGMFKKTTQLRPTL